MLTRAITPADLKRYLDVYARRIRTISNWDRTVHVSSQVLQALQVATDFKPGALSPSLQRFDTATLKPDVLEETTGNYHSDINIGSTIWLFVHPQMKAINISASSSDPLYLSSIHLTATRLPNLKELTIGIGYESLEDPFVDRYLEASSWEQLETLHVHVDCTDNFAYLKRSTIQHLARLPCLKELALHDMMDVPPPLHALDLDGRVPLLEPWPYPFPSLAILSLNAFVPSDITAFLGYLPPKSKLSSLVCDTLNEGSDEDTRRIIIMALQRCDHDALKAFTMKVNEVGEEDEAVELDEDGGLSIEPLLAFKLHRIRIVINGPCRITPEIAAQIPAAWPAMKTMEFRSTFSTTQIPSIDHTHLLALVRSLPLLEHLGIRFNATKISGHELAAGAPLPLKTLYVGDSPISSPSKTTSFIKANFSLRKPPSTHWRKTWKIPLCRTRWEVVRTSFMGTT